MTIENTRIPWEVSRLRCGGGAPDVWSAFSVAIQHHGTSECLTLTALHLGCPEGSRPRTFVETTEGTNIPNRCAGVRSGV